MTSTRKVSATVSEQMDRAADRLADARLEYAIADSNLAAARAELTRAERDFHAIWGKALSNPAKVAFPACERALAIPRREPKP